MPKPQQGQPYIVAKGDTLQSIAVRAYGSAAKWSKIYRANADKLRSKNADLIYVGESIFIPFEDEIAKAKADARANQFAQRPKGSFNLVIGDREIKVPNGRFLRGVDLLVSSWSTEIPWTPGADAALDKLLKRFSYAPSELYLGPTLVATGKLYGSSPKADKGSVTRALECFSSTADIEDSSVPSVWSEVAEVNLKQIASEFCDAFGAELVFSTSSGKAFDLVQRQGGETVGALLKRLAKQRGALVSCDERARVLFFKATTSGKPVAALKQPQPLPLSWTASFDGRARYATYKAVGQSGDAAELIATAKDKAVPGIRFLEFSATDADAPTLKDAAAWRRSKALADALSVPFPVADWYTPAGDLWTPNTLVTVESAFLDLIDPVTMLIRSVEYAIAGDGRTATLSLVPPWTLAGGEPEAPWV